MFNVLDKLRRLIQSYRAVIKEYANDDAVLIYQMGKVGSTSLEKSLPNAIHVHAFFNRNHTCPIRLKGFAKFGIRQYLYRAEQEFRAWLIRQTIKKRKHTKIITLVRDPLARNISMFFHDLDAYLFAAHTNCLNTRPYPLSTRHQDINLLSLVFEQEFNHSYPLTWFDNELKVMTGLDVFDVPFDKSIGYSHLSNKRFSVICVKVDNLTYNLPLLSEFIGKEIELNNFNEAKSKWYADVYKAFKVNYQPSYKLASKLYQSRFYKHFFE